MIRSKIDSSVLRIPLSLPATSDSFHFSDIFDWKTSFDRVLEELLLFCRKTLLFFRCYSSFFSLCERLTKKNEPRDICFVFRKYLKNGNFTRVVIFMKFANFGRLSEK